MNRTKRGGLPPEVGLPPELEVRHLRAFVTLAELGRVTAAAEALRLAQSTLSETIAALERALGTPVTLHRRGSRDAMLTAAGHALLPHARKVLTAVDDARVAVAGATRSARAHVDIVANESVSTYLLPTALARLRYRWPNMRFTVSVAPCLGVRDGVASGAFDLGLLLERADECVPASPSASPASTPFRNRRTVVSDVCLAMFAGPGHALGRGAVRRSALTPYPLLVSDAAFDFHTFVHRYVRRGHEDGPHIEAAGSVEGVKKGVIADKRALGLLPAYAIAEELRLGRVVRLDLRPPPPRMRLDALLSESRVFHRATEELLDAVREAFAPAPESKAPHRRRRGAGRLRATQS
jgi:DNA-binding transcriptional LysR family regulator